MKYYIFLISITCSLLIEGKVDPPASYMNCVACHLLDKEQVGPALIEIAELYPQNKSNEFIDWCINPGKKRPEMAQMPSMAHLPKEQLKEIHNYILTISKGKRLPSKTAKKDLFKNMARPRVIRTFLPKTSPASIVVCLPSQKKHNLVWDTTHCALRYISRGEVDNWPYLRSNGNSLATVGKIIQSFPLKNSNEKKQFLGYRIKEDGLPTFFYSINGEKKAEDILLKESTLTIIVSAIQNNRPSHKNVITTSIELK